MRDVLVFSAIAFALGLNQTQSERWPAIRSESVEARFESCDAAIALFTAKEGTVIDIIEPHSKL